MCQTADLEGKWQSLLGGCLHSKLEHTSRHLLGHRDVSLLDGAMDEVGQVGEGSGLQHGDKHNLEEQALPPVLAGAHKSPDVLWDAQKSQLVNKQCRIRADYEPQVSCVLPTCACVSLAGMEIISGARQYVIMSLCSNTLCA